jgi:hypothetical protein
MAKSLVAPLVHKSRGIVVGSSVTVLSQDSCRKPSPVPGIADNWLSQRFSGVDLDAKGSKGQGEGSRNRKDNVTVMCGKASIAGHVGSVLLTGFLKSQSCTCLWDCRRRIHRSMWMYVSVYLRWDGARGPYRGLPQKSKDT